MKMHLDLVKKNIENHKNLLYNLPGEYLLIFKEDINTNIISIHLSKKLLK